MNILASFSTGVAFKPPSGGLSFWSCPRSDFRVTGSRASASRERTFLASTPARMRANPGAFLFACRINAGRAAMSVDSRALGERISSLSKCNRALTPIFFISSKPAFSSPVGLDVAEAFAAARREPQVELLHVLVLGELLAGAVHHHAAVLEDVAVVGVAQRDVGVLFGEQEAHAFLAVQLLRSEERRVGKECRSREAPYV